MPPARARAGAACARCENAQDRRPPSSSLTINTISSSFSIAIRQAYPLCQEVNVRATPRFTRSPPNPFIRTLAGLETRVAKLPYQVRITSWAADGRTLVGHVLEAGTRWDLWLFSASGEAPPTPLLKSRFSEQDGRISPDNRWIAFTSNETGVAEIYVTTFPKLGRPVRVSTDGGIGPRWRDDGTELFFESQRKVMAASITAPGGTARDGGPTVGVPRELFALPENSNDWIPAKGGQRFLINMQETKGVPAPIQVVLNWSQPAQTQ